MYNIKTLNECIRSIKEDSPFWIRREDKYFHFIDKHETRTSEELKEELLDEITDLAGEYYIVTFTEDKYYEFEEINLYEFYENYHPEIIDDILDISLVCYDNRITMVNPVAFLEIRG